jgi:hypothetical protein
MNVYIPRTHTHWTGIEEHTTSYKMGMKLASHRFCKHCGVPVRLTFEDEIPKEVWDNLPEFVKGFKTTYTINTRILKDMDAEAEGLKIIKHHQGVKGYEFALEA